MAEIAVFKYLVLKRDTHNKRYSNDLSSPDRYEESYSHAHSEKRRTSSLPQIKNGSYL